MTYRAEPVPDGVDEDLAEFLDRQFFGIDSHLSQFTAPIVGPKRSGGVSEGGSWNDNQGSWDESPERSWLSKRSKPERSMPDLRLEMGAIVYVREMGFYGCVEIENGDLAWKKLNLT
jgi:hypothetical protein